MEYKKIVKTAIKAGLIIAGVFILVGSLDIIPGVKCIINSFVCLLCFTPGILACYLYKKLNKVVLIGEGALLGVIAGPVSTINSVVTVPISVLFTGVNKAGLLQSMGSEVASTTATLGDLVSIVIGIPIYIIVVGIVLAAINAGTGALYTVIINW